MGDPLVTVGAALLGLAMLGAVAILFAWLLRRSEIPGGALAAGLTGGLIAGALLGPGVLGRAAPELHESMFLGGVAERAELERAELEIEGAAAALESTGVSEAALREHLEAGENELAALRDDLTWARDDRRGIFNAAALLAFSIILITAPWRSAGRPRADDEPAQGPILSGLCSLLVAGVPAALLSVWTLGLDRPQALAFGAAIGIGAMCPGLRARVVGSPGRRRGVDRSAITAFVGGALVISALTLSNILTAMFALPLLALLIAMRAPASRTVKRVLKGMSSSVMAPVLTALACIHFDPVAGASTWPFWIAILIAVVFSSDGRWLGGWLGWWSGGTELARGEAWRRSAASLNAGVGAVQIGAALALAGAGLLNDRLLMAVAVGAITVELTAGVRIHFARMFDRGEPFAPPSPPDA
ncbi:MAG: hypothetical protein EA376_00965 [Phycisphaeraceae bacterium]|nr:MAG: hypothetical protein EA376_00965 [Phycisphaeraceae bacterium]